MGFMDKLKELTQPYDDDEDFFEGADPSFKPQPKAKPEAPASKPAVSQAQKFFESSFDAEACGAGSARRRRRDIRQSRHKEGRPPEDGAEGAHSELRRKGHLGHPVQPQELR